MKSISIAQAQKLMATGKFFSIKGYTKADGTKRDFNARQGVKVHSNGGSWNGNASTNLLLAEPVSKASRLLAESNNKKVNPYRTLKLASLSGCTLKAGGQEYLIK